MGNEPGGAGSSSHEKIMGSTSNSSGRSEPPVPETVAEHPAWFRLNDQQKWYETKSQYCQRWYKRLKFVQIALAVVLPATTLLPAEATRWSASIAGTLIAFLEALQQLNQYSTLWVTYRGTAERLRHEQYLFLSGAGPYKDLVPADRLIALAERVESVISTEHTSWSSETSRTSTPQPGQGAQKAA